MKHIKTYENINNFKNFLIIKASNKFGFLLLEVNDYDGKFVYFTALFKLYKDKIITIKSENNLIKDRLEKRIIYQSDSLSDALDKLKMIKETSKYNL